MLIKNRTNYCILSEKSDFLLSTVSKFIQNKNQEEEGLYPVPSLFGQCIIVSNTDFPNKKKYIISHIQRDEAEFDTLDLDKDPLPVLYEVLGINCKEYKSFVRNKVYNKPSVKPNSLYYYMILLRECISDTGFNVTKAQLIIENCKYQSASSQLDKYRAINNYVMRPTEDTLFKLIKVFSIEVDESKRMTSIVYCIKSILESTVPSYIESRLSFSQDSAVLLQYLMLSAEVALFEDMDQFISNMIAKLP